jgi:hypothetical protein
MAGGLLVGAALIVLAGQTQAQFGRGPARPEVRGILKAVDASAGTITVMQFEGRQGPPTEKTYKLAKDLEVGVDAGGGRRGALKEAKLADLPLEAPVGLQLSADQTTVESIVSEGPVVRGRLKEVDAAKKSLTVVVQPSRRDQDEEEKSFVLAPGAEIGADDGRGRRFSVRAAELTDLSPGVQVTVWLSLDQKQALAVLAEGPSLLGRVKAVDAGKNTLTLTLGPTRGEDTPEEKTLAVAADALVVLDDGRGRRLSAKEGKLADVPVGAAVQLRLSANQSAITSLRAEGPTIPGLIKSVDAAKGTITIAVPIARGEAPEEKTYPVAKDVRIVIDGNEAKLSDVKPTDEGPFAMVRLTLDSKTVQALTLGGRGR